MKVSELGTLALLGLGLALLGLSRRQSELTSRVAAGRHRAGLHRAWRRSQACVDVRRGSPTAGYGKGLGKVLPVFSIALLVSGCQTTEKAIEGAKTDPDYSHAQVVLDVPYRKSVDAIYAWAGRCYPNGKFAMSFPLFIDSSGLFVNEEDGMTRVQVLRADTAVLLPNTLATAGSVLVNAELTPDGIGTHLSVDAWRAADAQAKRLQRIIVEGGLTSCWK